MLRCSTRRTRARRTRITSKKMKTTKLKGILALSAVVIVMISYLIYNYYYYEYKIKLNELNFISTGIAISIFSGLLFTFFQNKWIRTVLLYCSTFYAMLILCYSYSWIIHNHAYAYIKLSMFLGLLIGIIYVIYDFSTNRTNSRT